MHAAGITYFFAPAEFLQVVRYRGFLSTTRTRLIVAALLVCAPATACTSPRAPARAAVHGIRNRIDYLGRVGAGRLPQCSPYLFRGPEARVPARITRTPAFGLIYSQYINDRYTRGLRLNRLADYCSAAIQPNVVLVLVEAWGLAREMALRRAIDQPFSDPARYDVLRGSMPFVGHTTSGEGG